MERTREHKLDFIIQVLYAAVICGLCYLCLRYLLGWTLPFLLGLLLAALAQPGARWLAGRTGLSPRRAGVLSLCALYLLAGGLLVGFGAALLDRLAEAADRLPELYRLEALPALESLGRSALGVLERVAPGLSAGMDVDLLLQRLQGGLISLSGALVGRLGAWTMGLPDLLMTVLFTVASSLMIAANYRETTGFLLRQLPRERRPVAFTLKEGAWSAFGAYLRAYLLLCATTFAELSVGLWLLRVGDFWVIALMTALLDLLPVVGSGVVLLPWALLSLLQGNTPMAAGLAMLYAINLLVHNLLEQRLVSSQLGIHPLAGLCAAYLGFCTLGMAGMLLAPLAVRLALGLRQAGVIRLWK